MSYGLKYTSQFDSFKQLQSYQVDIYQKDYIGDAINFLLSGTPVVQDWQEDDPKAPIRGCTFKVSIITNEFGVKLIDFYSEDDKEFYLEFSCTTTNQFLFKGYLLQDDCTEIQLDFNHEISLTFTDMLGTLKDITLNEAAQIVGTLTTATSSSFYNPEPVANNTVCSFDAIAGTLQAGDSFILYDGTNTYNLICYNISYNIALGWCINIGIPCPFPNTVTAELSYYTAYPLEGYIPLRDVIKLCLKSTLLDIGLRSYVTIFPQGGTNLSTWDDTFVDANTFKSDANTWMNCYDILEQIMLRFNASLFQADAIWHIVRWDEMYRYIISTGVYIYGNGYDNNFNYTGTITSDSNFGFMGGSDMESGVMKSIERPFQYVKETFNYNQPGDLLKNPNLQELGNFRTEYIDANNDLIKEYDLVSWTITSLVDSFIRVAFYNDITLDNYGDEKYRFIVVTGSTTNYLACVKSNNIYLSKGDSINYTFQWASGTSNSGPFRRHVLIQFTPAAGGAIQYLDRYGQWNTTFDVPNILFFSMPAGDNEQNFHTWDIISTPVPSDGTINVFLFEADDSAGSNEFYFNNFNFSIKSYYAGQNNVIGHTHTDSQVAEIKNNFNKEIFLDNSPSWYIKGTLFLENGTAGLRDRCTSWGYPLYFFLPLPLRFAYPNLGQGTTQEDLYTRFKPRAKYEGTLLYVLNGNGPYKFVNPLSTFVNILNSNYRYVPGKLSIDYKNANCNLTLFEIVDDINFNSTNRLIGDYKYWLQTKIYEFNYLYENK